MKKKKLKKKLQLKRATVTHMERASGGDFTDLTSLLCTQNCGTQHCTQTIVSCYFTYCGGC